MSVPKIPKEGILSFDFHRHDAFTDKQGVFHPLHYHKGIDFPATIGTPVYVVEDGIVEHASNIYKTGFSDYGRIAVIKGKSGKWFLYAHLDSTILKPGQKVKRGDKVGEVGRTGFNKRDPNRLITGAHLHFEVSNHKYPQDSQSTDKINPADWLEENGIHPFLSETADTKPDIKRPDKQKLKKS